MAHAYNSSTWEAETGVIPQDCHHNCYLPFKLDISWVWWPMPVIPVLGRLRQEDHRFEANLSNLGRPCFKLRNKKSQEWWHMLVIPVLGMLRQEDPGFVASLSNLVRPCFKIKNKIGLGV